MKKAMLFFVIAISALFLIIGCAVPSSNSGSGSNGTTNSAPTTNITYWTSLGTKVVADCDDGTIYTSTNGTSWAKVIPGVSVPLNKITNNGSNLFIAVGNNGTIITSPDGLSWTKQFSGTTKNLHGIIWNSTLSLFIAVGNNGTILTSLDTLTWTPQTSGTTNELRDIRYYNSLLIVRGYNGTILTSPNGTTWTPQNSNTTGNINGISYNGSSLIVAVSSNGIIITSPNGTAWTQQTQQYSVNLAGAIWNPSNSLWIVEGDNGTILTSSDANNDWTLRTSGATDNLSNGIAYNGAFSLLIGVSNVLMSTNGTTWTPNNLGAGTVLTNEAYVSSLSMYFLFGNNKTIFYSTDGSNWNNAIVP